MSDLGPKDDLPKGSGIFALVFGLVSLTSALFSNSLSQICADDLFSLWLALSGAILSYWGIVRIGWIHRKHVIGQGTIGMVAGALAITFAIWTFALPETSKHCSRSFSARVEQMLP